MADYQQHYGKIQSAGASVAAVSVDAPAESEALKLKLSLAFPILCDTEHRVIKDWGICNSRVRGGIAEPAVFIIGTDRAVRYAALDGTARRVSAAEMVYLLSNPIDGQPVRRRVHLPLLSDWIRAISNW